MLQIHEMTKALDTTVKAAPSTDTVVNPLVVRATPVYAHDIIVVKVLDWVNSIASMTFVLGIPTQ